MEEEHIPADENVSHEDQDTLLNTPSLSGETEPAVREVETEEKMQQSGDDKLKMLEEMRQEGLITEEDYKHKLNELSSPQPHDAVPALSKKEIEDDKLSELNELREQGLISDEDYEFKKTQLMGK